MQMESDDEAPPTQNEALTALRVMRQFISASSNEMSVGMKSYLNCVENMIFHCIDTS